MQTSVFVNLYTSVCESLCVCMHGVRVCVREREEERLHVQVQVCTPLETDSNTTVDVGF